MKRRLLSLLLLTGVVGLPLFHAQAQDKPVLNTAPPGPPTPTPTPRTTEPTPTPVPEPAPVYDTPTPRPSPDAPSGLSFPNRAETKAGGAEDAPPTRKFVYANVGLGFSSYEGLNQFNVSAAPAIGYRVTDKFAIGPGISYAYSSYGLSKAAQQAGYALNSQGDKSISSSSLGFKAFAQYIVYKEFFVHAEYEVTNAELIGYDNASGYFKFKRTVATPLAGVGYRSTISDKAAFDIVGLYNFDYSALSSLYPNFLLRFSLLYNIGK